MHVIVTMLLLLLALALLLIIAVRSRNRSLQENMETKYTLGLLVIAKNETMVINEYIEHYLWQGVEQIYFIDNGSTDDTKRKLVKYIQKGQLQYFDMPEKHKQEEHYNHIYNSVAKQECKWLIVCDVDEYIYNRSKGKNIQDYLSTLDYNKVGQVLLNWKMFGSAGFEKQPAHIRDSFVLRKNDLDENTKCIVNTDIVNLLRIHKHDFKDPSAETITRPPELALNHYAIMSKEYFSTVKMTRGDVSTMAHENVRDWDYFTRYDFKEVYDDELKILLKDK